MRRRTLGGAAAVAALSSVLGACGGCSKRASSEAAGDADAAALPSETSASARCRPGGARLALSGEDVVVGDAALGPSGLLVGLVRTEAGRRVAAVLRASPDLSSSQVIELGTAYGDDPPPTPRYQGTVAYVAYLARIAADGGGDRPKTRELRIVRLDESGAAQPEARVLQQADESTAFDVAWSDDGAGLAAWDEDAPTDEPGPSERGLVKVQPLREGARARVASPASSDAESPRLLARPSGGFWLAWLARRAEEKAYAVEGPAESRAFRWIEAVALSAQGEPEGPVRRVSSDTGRAASFELATSGSDLIVFVQDEAASAEGAGARILQYVLGGASEPIEVVEGGIDEGLAAFVPIGGSPEGARWIAWTDTTERTRLLPVGPGLDGAGGATPEPALDGARVLAAAPPDAVYALTGAAPTSEEATAKSDPAVQRFACGIGRGD